jgi:predicted transposase/invertase (TIGR01784 family)
MQLHFIELPKYDRWKKKQEKEGATASQPPQSHLDQWIQFFKINNLSETQTQKLLEEPIMSKAFNALEEISNDPESKSLAELREKARINLHIITSEAKAAAKAEGIAEGKAAGKEEGKAEGKAEGIKENIRRMSEKGYPADEIARVFDISEEEVQSILKMPK